MTEPRGVPGKSWLAAGLLLAHACHPASAGEAPWIRATAQVWTDTVEVQGTLKASQWDAIGPPQLGDNRQHKIA